MRRHHAGRSPGVDRRRLIREGRRLPVRHDPLPHDHRPRAARAGHRGRRRHHAVAPVRPGMVALRAFGGRGMEAVAASRPGAARRARGMHFGVSERWVADDATGGGAVVEVGDEWVGPGHHGWGCHGRASLAVTGKRFGGRCTAHFTTGRHITQLQELLTNVNGNQQSLARNVERLRMLGAQSHCWYVVNLHSLAAHWRPSRRRHDTGGRHRWEGTA